MSLSKEIEKLKYDKRLMDWNLSRGKVSKAELDSYLGSLPDLSHNVEEFSLGHDSDDLNSSSNNGHSSSNGEYSGYGA